MITLILVDLEYETSVSIWEFEMMIVLNDSISSIQFSYMIKFTVWEFEMMIVLK